MTDNPKGAIPAFDPRRDEPKPPAEPGPGDDVPCVNCGERALDTGLECDNCGFDNHEAVTGKPFPKGATPAAAAEMPLTDATGRTATDYALEFAEYLAKHAEELLEAMNAEDALRLRREESDDVSDDDMHDAAADRVEQIRAVRNGIYEFRKRRDRAAKSRAAEIVPLTDEREAFEVWARNRGYQSDELARCRIGIVASRYFNLNTEEAWQAWQARAAIATKAAPASETRHEESTQASAPPRFFFDHGKLHDRETGQHLHTEADMMEACSDAASNARDEMRATDPWRRALDDKLVNIGLDCLGPGETPQQAIKRLIEWETTTALDPAVSEQAQALIEQGRASAPQVVEPVAWANRLQFTTEPMMAYAVSTERARHDDVPLYAAPPRASAPSVQVPQSVLTTLASVLALARIKYGNQYEDVNAIFNEADAILSAQASAQPAAQQPDPIGTKAIQAETLLDALSNNLPLSTDQRAVLYTMVIEADAIQQKFDAELERIRAQAQPAAPQPAKAGAFAAAVMQLAAMAEATDRTNEERAKALQAKITEVAFLREALGGDARPAAQIAAERAAQPAAEPEVLSAEDESVAYPRDFFSRLIHENSPYAFYIFQWVPYQTDAKRWRLKLQHDVRTFDGREALNVWPNGSHCGPFRDDEVEFIRISRSQFGEEWKDPRPSTPPASHQEPEGREP